jgi:SAM-dependent methyltransferase
METRMPDLISPHYDDKYFAWQAPLGKFGGWANQSKFIEFISPESRALDFGCGGGYLLKNRQCGKKVGVEVNPSAIATARANGLEVFGSLGEVPNGYVDVIVSTTRSNIRFTRFKN